LDIKYNTKVMAAHNTGAPMLNAAMVIEKRSSTADQIAALPDKDNDIRIVSPSEYKEAAASLAEAFREDHVVRYPIDTPDRVNWSEEDRYALHRQVLEYVTYAHCLRGLATTVGKNYGCVALWMPPGKNMDDWLTILQSGMWRIWFKLSSEGNKRFFDELLPLLHRTKEEVLGARDPEAWYLLYIGTRPGSTRKGYARKLIEHVTRQADREGRPSYLESSNDINPLIYGKLGFEVVKKIYLKRDPKEVLSIDIMVREPVLERSEREKAK
jgi:ribosomal protein S18 acetylase RimI-like enzyme